MSKVDTEEGLGPGSEDRRREVLEAQKELDSRSKMKAAAPVPVEKSADTQPGIGKVDRRSDTVDDLLDGFGPSRPDLPRILPKEDTTPPPEPIKKELTPTQPGKRQRMRNMILATVVSFGVIVGLGVVIVKMGAGSSAAAPTTSAPAATNAASVETSAPVPTQTIAPITTMSVEALPTATTTTTAHSTHSTHSSNHTAASSTTTAATTAAPHPTGSAPPGMNLLPDDPHR